MEIAIDTGPLDSGHAIRGVGVNTKELIEAIEKIIKRSSNKEFKVNAVDFSKTDITKFDLVHYTAFHPYFPSVPDHRITGKVILTIHDLIYLIYPDKYPSGFKGKINFYKNKSRLKNVDAVLTISETSKKDIVRFLGFPAEKIKVIYLAAKEIYKPIKDNKKLLNVKKKYKLPEKFVLFVVGGVNYNKNIPNLVKACTKAKIPLVIAGKEVANLNGLVNDITKLSGPRDYLRYVLNKPHPELDNYQELKRLFANEDILRPGFVSDEDLVAFYNLASIYVQPSFYEGFGLPVLEAMACGTPVIVSKTNALVEVAEDAALTFDPNNIDELTQKIKNVLEDKKLQKELSEKSLRRAKEFSWEKTAEQTLQFYKYVLNDN